jgi:hypothetical protein
MPDRIGILRFPYPHYRYSFYSLSLEVVEYMLRYPEIMMHTVPVMFVSMKICCSYDDLSHLSALIEKRTYAE